MKKYIFLVLLALITSFAAFSQKNLKEFQMSYEITDIDMKGAQGAIVSKMMKGSTMTMSIKGSKNKIAMNMMQGMMRQETYTDSKAKNMNSFISMMGRKMEILGMDSIYKHNLEKPDTAAQTEIVQKPTATGKKKEILGYQCEEFISKTKDKDKNIITYSIFVAKDLKADKSVWENTKNSNMSMFAMDGRLIDGMPLQMTITMKEMEMTFEAQALEEEVDEDEFDMPKGYDKIHIRDLAKQAGGLGF